MSYSYSKLTTYKKCPYKFKLHYIDKLDVFSDSEIFERGRYIHALFENYPNEEFEFDFNFPQIREAKPVYKKFVKELIDSNKQIKTMLSNKMLLHREYNFFLDSSLDEMKLKDGSTYNGIIDYVGKIDDSTLMLGDWKSGKTRNNASLNQLEFYSMWAFKNNPQVEHILLSLVFVEQDNPFFTKRISRNQDFTRIKEEYASQINKIESTTDYCKKASEDCQHCQFYKMCEPYKINLQRN